MCSFPINVRGVNFHSTPAGDDGFYYISGYRLYETHRANPTPIPHLERLENRIMEVRPGPNGSILIELGYTKRGDAGLLYFPDDNAVIYLEPELFGETDILEIKALFWSEVAGRIIAIHRDTGEIRALPVEFVLSLPRHNAKTGRKLKR